jgi:hypothetical protein
MHKNSTSSQIQETVADEIRQKSYNLRVFGQQIFAASLANIAGGIAGHPLDTIRVSQCEIILILTVYGLDSRPSRDYPPEKHGDHA